MEQISPQTLKFLKDLKANNERAWFNGNKKRHEAARANLEAFIAALIPRIAKFDESIAGCDPRKSIFRIYRDTRFSKDKTPYKTNMGAHLLDGGSRNLHNRAGYYVHVEPGNCFLAGGAYLPPAAWLNAIRKRIDRDAGTLKNLLKRKSFRETFGGIDGERLKTAPRGYPKDHPEIELLRYKSFLAVHKVSEKQATTPDYLQYATRVFKVLQPFDAFLNGVSK